MSPPTIAYSILAWARAFLFFTSRRRHTRSLCDWSSDVCSSDLSEVVQQPRGLVDGLAAVGIGLAAGLEQLDIAAGAGLHKQVVVGDPAAASRARIAADRKSVV